MTNNNLNQCCRLCLTDKVNTLRSIFDETVEDRALLAQKIELALAVEITIEDKLSTNVCITCVNKINDWYVFRQKCSENQIKLEQWLQLQSTGASDLHHMSIQIKEEPVDADEFSNGEVINDEVPVKSEPLEEEFNDLPPPLTPQGRNGETDEIPPKIVTPTRPKRRAQSGSNVDQSKCKICDKVFSTPANRRKHEKTMHGINPFNFASVSLGASSYPDKPVMESSPPPEPNAEEQKILFAAGLKLLQRKSSPPISSEALSKIEISYTDKCKAMAVMHRNLICACHNAQHSSLKSLLSHLRSLRIWFPVYTCYNCMITLTDRSTNTRHHNRCKKKNLETLIKLSNLKKRSEVKTRLYQNYKCTQCEFMFSFHEDFCAHVDEVHCHLTLPFTCTCGRVFTKLEDYKDHSYISCLVEFYCDVCFATFKTLDTFRKHAAETHDSSAGFALLQDDNYRKKRSSIAPLTPEPTKAIKTESKEDAAMARRNRRKVPAKPPILLPQVGGQREGKVVNPCVVPRVPGLQCPLCSREYSSNNNMYRHYKSHFETIEEPLNNVKQPVDSSVYCCPDCGGMFNANEWDKHKEKHMKKACHECGKMFQFQAELDQHRSVHLNLKVYRDSKTKAYKSTMVSPNSEAIHVFTCDVCSSMFTAKEQYEAHKLGHEAINTDTPDASDKRRRFSCKLCGKTYLGYSGLYDHRKKKHPEAPLPFSIKYPRQCPYCDRTVKTAAAYTNHTLMHERENDQSAEDTAPRDFDLYDDEVNSNDDSESYHTCKRCFKVFSTRVGLRAHMKCHGITRPPSSKALKAKASKKVWCDVCHTPFDNNTLLNQHKTDDHLNLGDDQMPELIDERDPPDESKKAPFLFTCDICVQTFSTKIALKKHKEKHALEKNSSRFANTKHQTMFHCKHCKVSFMNPRAFNSHMVDEHSEPNPMVKSKSKDNKSCKTCKKTFKTPAALFSHMGWHKRENNRYSLVDERITVNEALKKEAKIAVEVFKCNKCNAVLPNDTALQIHILEKHRNVNAIALLARCNSCKLDFSTQDEYEKHKRLHNFVEKPQKTYPCKVCTANFSKPENLTAHLKKYHKDVSLASQSSSHVNNQHSDLKCTQCNRIFDKQSSLTIHLKVHEKQRLINGGGGVGVGGVNGNGNSKSLYSCSICNLGFNLPKDLRSHTIQVHPF